MAGEFPFIDSFDHYPQGFASLKYDVGFPTITAGEGTFGSSATRATGTGAFRAMSSSTITFAAYVRAFVDLGGGGIPETMGIFRTISDGSTGNQIDMAVRWTADGRIVLQIQGVNLTSDMGRSMHANTWHHVCINVTIHASPTPPSPPHTVDAQVYIDGVQVMNVSGEPAPWTFLSPIFSYAGLATGLGGATEYLDDLIINAAAVVYPPSNIIRLVPTADETTQWAEPPFPTPHFEQIDETLTSTADDIATGTPNNLDRFNGETLPLNIDGDPIVVQSVFYAEGVDKIWHVLNTDEFQGVYAVFSLKPLTGKTTAYVDSLLHGVRYTL